jgi:hypothetical protein
MDGSMKAQMPYETGETPAVGDHITKRGRLGIITHVQLRYPSFAGRDAVGIRWEDDGTEVAVNVADEFRLVRRGGA